MEPLDSLVNDPRIAIRRSGPPYVDGRCVVYWMQRAQRALDNPALETAIAVANALRKPVVVFFGIVPNFPNANLRHYAFLAQGISDLARRLERRGIGLVLWRYPHHSLIKFCDKVRASLVIADENPLRQPERWRRQAAERVRVPFWTVDADVIVPSRLLEKEQYAARTIRPRLHKLLSEFLLPVGNGRPKVPWRNPRGLQSPAAKSDVLRNLRLDRSAQPVAQFCGGTEQALHRLRRFLHERLKGYAVRRNRPELDATSQLSPYLHFGHIGPHTVALEARAADVPGADREAFLEELIVRRELAVNFVRFNSQYDRLECAEPWALRTLRDHARDERARFYTEKQLENAETHDPLWNAAQKQMVLTGWMHGYMRMYWAKKILEWTRSADEAYAIAVRLNDRYELDGRDPNGYAGIAWAICGKHDRAWGPERPVYGTIRYMSDEGARRKFDSKTYIERVKALERNGDNP